MSLNIDEKKDNYVKVTWVVKLCEVIAKFYNSDQFKIINIDNISFSMKLELGGSSSNATFDLWVKKSNPEPALALIKVMVGDFSINQSQCWKSSSYFKNIIIPKETSVEKIIERTCKEKTLHNVYKLKITCEIHWNNTVKSSLNNNLCDKIQRFYNSEELSDVTIIVDQVRIPAHKVVLAAHSEVFSKMLQSEMKEAKDGEINIKYINPEVILEMLHYCYTGTMKAKNSVQIALQVLEVADIYQIIKLKEICELNLWSRMSIGNVLQIIDAADDHNAINLRQKAMEFILRRHKEVFPTNEFQELFFRKQKLMLEIVRALSHM
ncbi:TD and POZ domain-containing protein 1-like [Cotesia glomerata]|uniref:TD and POZ domain-containing protein 1-like n=1 Tax=Cotesia glomerata TaxID=32391 RepID=UPI001D005369|nr:TD and POZ domain-containing protein 1-like [Cotesia glomerata]